MVLNNSNVMGGASRVFLDQVEKLRGYNGIEVRHVYFSNSIPKTQDSTYIIKDRRYGIAHNPFYSFYSINQLKTIVDEFAPDVVHLHIYYGKFTVSILKMLRRRGIKIVQTVHDNRYICQSNNMFLRGTLCDRCNFTKKPIALYYKCNGNLTRTFINFVEQKLYSMFSKYINVLIFVSETQRARHIIKHPNMLHRSMVIYNSIGGEETLFYKQKKTKPTSILVLSRITEGKGISELIDLFTSTDLHENFILNVAGDGPQREYLEQKHHNLISQGRLNFLGNLGAVLKEKALLDASIVVSPSKMFETFGLTLIEAAKYQKISIAINSGAHPEISQLICGYTYSSEDELLSLLKNKDKLTGSKLPKIFESEFHYGLLINLYKKLMGS